MKMSSLADDSRSVPTIMDVIEGKGLAPDQSGTHIHEWLEFDVVLHTAH